MAFTHDTKPKIKNNIPIMKIEIKLSRFDKEFTSIVAVIALSFITLINDCRQKEVQQRIYQDIKYNWRVVAKCLQGKGC